MTMPSEEKSQLESDVAQLEKRSDQLRFLIVGCAGLGLVGFWVSIANLGKIISDGDPSLSCLGILLMGAIGFAYYRLLEPRLAAVTRQLKEKRERLTNA